MPFINGGHIWLILGLIVLLVVFGPGKLPELGSAVGKTIKAFKRSTEDLKAEMTSTNPEPVADSPRFDPATSVPARSEPVVSTHSRTEA